MLAWALKGVEEDCVFAMVQQRHIGWSLEQSSNSQGMGVRQQQQQVLHFHLLLQRDYDGALGLPRVFC